MSKIVYIYSKEKLEKSIAKKLKRVCDKINPDNIIATPTRVEISENIAFGISNPTSSLSIEDYSILLGKMIDQKIDWLNSSYDLLDGSFAIFREKQDRLELISDITGSRTIWYYFNDKILIASTSQRAIIMLLGSFDLNKKVIPWILSTGGLGYLQSWDSRIKAIPADSIMSLDKESWSISIESNPIEFNPIKLSKEESKNRLKKSITDIFKSMDIDLDRWRLPLSGGYDSRGILAFIAQEQKDILPKLKTVTWGKKSALKDKKSDAYIAKRVAKHFDVPFKYYTTDLSSEPLEKVINRFLYLGEGRVDHISGYMDGFKIWKEFFEDGVEGLIRGDEGFGWIDVSSPLSVRLSIGCALCSDFSNLKKYPEFNQEFPTPLQQREGESIYMWRDRLYHQYRLPTMLSSLTYLKLGYVEQVNPLLSREIFNIIRELPDEFRNNKLIFKEIVNDMVPIDVASKNAIASPKDILEGEEFLKLLELELQSSTAKDILPVEFLDTILNNIRKKSNISIKEVIKSILPMGIKKVIKNQIKDNTPLSNQSYKVLGFRVFIIVRMNKILQQDRNFLK